MAIAALNHQLLAAMPSGSCPAGRAHQSLAVSYGVLFFVAVPVMPRLPRLVVIRRWGSRMLTLRNGPICGHSCWTPLEFVAHFNLIKKPQTTAERVLFRLPTL